MIFTETLSLVRCCTAFNVFDSVENIAKLVARLNKSDYPEDIVIGNISKCLTRKYLLHKYDHHNISYFIPDLLNYNTRYKYRNNNIKTIDQ